MRKGTISLFLVMLGFLAVFFSCFWSPPAYRMVLRPLKMEDKGTFVVDPGHGGEDGGAVSAQGTVESDINLAISLRLDALLGLYGADVKLLRDSDVSLHSPDAATLREKKNSDLRNRVKAVQETPGATLVSIHQNSYPGAQVSGAQVFYGKGEGSRELAEYTQENLRQALDPENDRVAKPISDSVYLMKHIDCTAILVECGFLTNPQEEALLTSPDYQTKVAAALCGSLLSEKEPMEGERSNEG